MIEQHDDSPTRTQRSLRFSFFQILLGVIIGAVLTGTISLATGNSRLTPAMAAEKLIDCIGAETTVATDPISIDSPSVIVSERVSGFSAPTAISMLANNVLLVAEKSGKVLRFDLETSTSVLIGDLGSQIDASAENGLLGMAIHPKYGIGSEDRLFVLFTRALDRALIVASVSVAPKGQLDIGSMRVYATVPRRSNWHAGGGMQFLPNGILLVGVGDDTKPNEAQNLSSFLGKIIAVDVDDVSVGPQIVASGLRNPYRIALEPNGTNLWISDVGYNCIEEIDRFTVGGSNGEVNFGWPLMEGNREWPRYLPLDYGFASKDSAPEKPMQFTAPVTTYAHVSAGACAVIGGAFLRNWYLFADYCDGVLRGLPIDAAPGTEAARLYDFKETGKQVGVIGVVGDAAGRAWVLDGWNGSIYEVEIAP